jgi:hypothetical protein
MYIISKVIHLAISTYARLILVTLVLIDALVKLGQAITQLDLREYL